MCAKETLKLRSDLGLVIDLELIENRIHIVKKLSIWQNMQNFEDYAHA